MECREVLKQLDAFADDELEPSVSNRIDRHLERCGVCRREYEQRRRLVERLRRAALAEPVPARLQDRVRSVLERERRRGGRRSRRRWLRRVAAAAVLLVGVVLGVGLMPGPASAELVAHHVACVAVLERLGVSEAERAGVLCRTVGASIDVPDFRRCGFSFAGAKLCEVGGRRVLHLLYRNERGEVLSVFEHKRVGGFLRRGARVSLDHEHAIICERIGLGGEIFVVSDTPALCERLRTELDAQLEARGKRR